jgi:AcrR family transcriptional regulator
MARRSAHTHEELRELILRSAQAIIEQGGFQSLSARELARKVGYSPGTLYNIFQNLDDLVLHVEARLLAELNRRLAEIGDDHPAEEMVRLLARTYFAFTHERPHLWSVLLEHNISRETTIPAWYREVVDGLVRHAERALVRLLPDADPASLRRSACILWTSVHGISTLANTHKLSGSLGEPAQGMLDEFVTIYLDGLRRRCEQAQRPAGA